MNDTAHAGHLAEGRWTGTVSQFIWLLCVVALGAGVRTYMWFNGYALNGQPGLVRHGDGYLQIAEAFRPGSTAGFFDHWRSSYQFIYPLYLAPIFAFDLNDGIYVFWLHHAFAAATICLIYFSARRIGGVPCAMLATLVYAVHLQSAYWFNWAFADTAYHFHLSLFLFCVVAWWDKSSIPRALCVAACALIMSFTRPEGFVVTAAFAAAVCFRLLSRRMGPWRALAVVGGTAICLAVALVSFISQSKPVREAVLSNVGVGWGLYYGSHRTPTRAVLVDEILLEMRRYGLEKASIDPEHRSQWYWSSMAGLDRIRAHPLSYVGYSAERMVNAFFPSFFRQGVSLRYKVFDRALAFFLMAGVVVALTAKHRLAPLMRALAFAALGVYVLVSFYQAEWDVRVQLSAHVFLIPIASLGWVIIANRVRTRLFPGDAAIAGAGAHSSSDR